MHFLYPASVFLVLSIGVAAAADTGAVLACRSVAEAEARLACFDRASAALAGEGAAGTAAPSIVSAPPSAPGPDFGLPAKPIGSAAAALAARVVSVDRDTLNRRVFALDNGQVWRQLEPAPLSGLREGAAVEIAESGYGGFRLRVDGYQAMTSVKRLK